jgi:hypothetical protein
MANTGRISGKDLYITFGGTEVHGDFTSVTINREDDQIDVTAGADTFHYFLSLARENGTMDFETFYDGATETVWDAIVPATAGTLIVAPKGTASANPKYTWTRALVANRNMSLPFDDGVRVTASFQFSSAVSETTY